MRFYCSCDLLHVKYIIAFKISLIDDLLLILKSNIIFIKAFLNSFSHVKHALIYFIKGDGVVNH